MRRRIMTVMKDMRPRSDLQDRDDGHPRIDIQHRTDNRPYQNRDFVSPGPFPH